MARIVGHRGAAGDALENTLPAFAKAIELGADVTEMDVRLTRDGQVVVFHDQDLLRLSGIDQDVNELSLKELKKIRLHGQDVIPTLQEVIDLTGERIDLMIELKTAGTPTPVAELIEKNRLQEQVYIASFEAGLLDEFKNVLPRVPLIFLFKHYSNFFLNPSAKCVWSTVDRLEAQYLGPRANLVSRAMLLKARARGLKVYAYTAHSKKIGQRLVDWGVDMIGTNNPEWFL